MYSTDADSDFRYKPEDFDLKGSDLEKHTWDNLPLSLKQYMESENPGEYGLKRIEKLKNNLGYFIDETPAQLCGNTTTPKMNIRKLKPPKIFVSPSLETRDLPKEKINFGDFDEAKKDVIEFAKKEKSAPDCKCDAVQVTASDVFCGCQQLEIDMEISDICFESLDKSKLQLLFELKVKNFLTEITKTITEIDEKNQKLEECLTTKRQWVNSSAKLHTIALKLCLQIHQMECDMAKIKYEVCGTLPQVVGSAECGDFCCKGTIKKIIDLQGKMDKVRTRAMLKESFLIMCEESKERIVEENKQLKKDIENSIAIVQKYEAELNKIKKSVCIVKGKTSKQSGRISQPKLLFSSDSDSDKNLSTKHSRTSRGSSSSPEGRPGKRSSDGRSNKRQSRNPGSRPKPPPESGTNTWPDEGSVGPSKSNTPKSGRSPSKNMGKSPNRPSKRPASPPSQFSKSSVSKGSPTEGYRPRSTPNSRSSESPIRNTDKCPIFHPGSRSSRSPSRRSSKRPISGGAASNSNLNSILKNKVLDSGAKSQSSNSSIDQENHGLDISVSILTRIPNNNSNIRRSKSSHGGNHSNSDNMSEDTESKSNEINKTGSSTSFDRLKPGFSMETIETGEISANNSKDPLSSYSVENMKQTTSKNTLRTSSEKCLLSSGKSFARSSHGSTEITDRRRSTSSLRRSVEKSGEDQTPKPGENHSRDNNVELFIYCKEKLRQTEIDVERLKKDNKNLEIKWKRCQDEVLNITNKYQNCLARNTEEHHLIDQIAILQHENTNLQNEIDEFRLELNRAKMENNTVSTQNRTLQLDLQKSKDQLGQRPPDCLQYIQKIANLETQMSTLNYQNESNIQNYLECKNKMEKYEDDLSKCHKELSKPVPQEVSEVILKPTDSTANCQEWFDLVHKLQLSLKIHRARGVRNAFMFNILEKERNDLKSENEDTKKKLKKYEEDLRKCRAEHSGPALLNQMDTLKTEIEKQRGLIKTSEDSNGHLMQQKEEALNDLRKCQEKLRKSKEDIDLASSGGDSFSTNQLSKLRKDNDQLNDDLEDQITEVNELTRQLKNCNENLEECRKKFKNSESDLAMLKGSDQSADRITREGISDDRIRGATFQGGDPLSTDSGVNNNPDSNGSDAPATNQKEIRDQIKKHDNDVRNMRRLYEVLQTEVQKMIKKLYCRPGSDKIQSELTNIYHAIDWMRRRICVCRGEDLDQALAPKCFKGEDQILHGICFQVTLSGIASLNCKQLIYLHCAVYKRGVKFVNRDCCDRFDQVYDTIRWSDEQTEKVKKSKKSCMKLKLLENEMDKTKRILNNLKKCCKI